MKKLPAKRPAFLVETSAGTAALQIRLASGRMRIGRRSLRVRPLFSSRAAQSDSRWHLVTPSNDVSGQNPWDAAHDIAAGLRSKSSGSSVYVEPDLEQDWPYQNRAAAMPMATKQASSVDSKSHADGSCRADPPDANWPMGAAFAWHLQDQYSQLKKARDAAGLAASKVRICILDTGYDPTHITVPEHIEAALEYNFVEGNANAADPGNKGLLYNPGHGVGTIALLAGNRVSVDYQQTGPFDDYLGGSPHAQIVPVRIANSVVHLWTSTMAQGIDYATGLAEKGFPCDVISISMGGLPSRAWAAAVNRAYDAGITIVAAAGNNYGGLPMRSLVWPARFERVIAACGVTAEQTPYYKPGLSFEMQGNFGPAEAMAHALAAYTPNTPWAELGCKTVIDLDGAGTSSATPQIAAAASLWLAMQGEQSGSGGQRVESVRNALFSSAMTLAGSSTYYGNGVVKAFDALSISPLEQSNSLPALPDDVVFPFLVNLPGWDGVDVAQAKMFEVEAAQLYASDSTLCQMYPELDLAKPGIYTDNSQKQILETLISHPRISLTLRAFLIAASRA